MRRSIHLSVLAVVLSALLLQACGGGGGEGGEPAAAVSKPPPAVLSRANANCRDFLHETKRIGRDALTGPPVTTLALTTNRLVKPSIPVLERIANRQQALEPAAHSAVFALYANLFDPIIVLAQSRLSSGRAEDYSRSKEIEERLTDLGLEQRHFARLASLKDCDLDFQHILLESLNE